MSRIGRKPVARTGRRQGRGERPGGLGGRPQRQVEWEFRPEIRVEHDAAAKALNVSRSSDCALWTVPPRLDPRAVLQNMMVAGTFELPEAQLDRFMLCHRLEYPSADDEKDIYRRQLNMGLQRQEGGGAVPNRLRYDRIESGMRHR